MTSALSTVQRTADVEHKLEDLARRLAGELGVEFTGLEKARAADLFFGGNATYNFSYMHLYEQETEDIQISRHGCIFPVFHIMYYGAEFSVKIDVDNESLASFAGRCKTYRSINQLDRRIANAIVQRTAVLKPRTEDQVNYIAAFEVPLSLSDADNLTGELIKRYLH